MIGVAKDIEIVYSKLACYYEDNHHPVITSPSLSNSCTEYYYFEKKKCQSILPMQTLET
jgi:hypothetical protein